MFNILVRVLNAIRFMSAFFIVIFKTDCLRICNGFSFVNSSYDFRVIDEGFFFFLYFKRCEYISVMYFCDMLFGGFGIRIVTY